MAGPPCQPNLASEDSAPGHRQFRVHPHRSAGEEPRRRPDLLEVAFPHVDTVVSHSGKIVSTAVVQSATRLRPGSRYRWTVLAVGTGAQAATSAYFQGLASIAPALRQANGLSLTGLGLLLAAPTAGLVLTLLAWGRASDRFGDRAVMTVGLTGSAGCLAGAALAHGAVTLGLLRVGAGAVGASVNAASGRAVLAWFTSSQRGMAMGIRQTAAPVGA